MKSGSSVHQQITQMTFAAIADMVGTKYPTRVAEAVLSRIAVLPPEPLVAYASLQYLKDVARTCLREKYEPGGQLNEAIQGDMFSGLLQSHYARAAEDRVDGEASYDELADITRKTWQFNIKRERKVGTAHLKHADALEAWGQDRPFPGDDEAGEA